jgi:DNA-binding transcriptional MocR family regulator
VAFYRENCNVLMEALDRELSGQVSYNRPDGGFFLWLELKETAGPIDCFEMIGTLAETVGVLLIPGSGFSLTSSLRNCLRVSYSMQTPENLTEGVRRLGRMLVEYSTLREQQAAGLERHTDG